MRTFALILILLCAPMIQADDATITVSLRLNLERERARDVKPEAHTKAAADVCPCSSGGVCTCTEANDCGCIVNREFRWVATAKSNQVALYRGTLQLGNWWHDEGQFKMLQEAYSPPRWIPMPCPVGPPSVKPLVYRVKETPATSVQWQLPPYRQQVFPPMSQAFPTAPRPVFNGGGFISGGNCGPSG
jgi:hypothetical protein